MQDVAVDQEGSGVSKGATTKPMIKTRKPQKKNVVTTCVARFITGKGWRKAFVEKELIGTTDYEFGFAGARQYETLEHYFRTYTSAWFSKTNRLGQATHTLFDKLYESGVTRNLVNRMKPIIGPLIDTCYSHEQLFDIVVDFVLGKYEPVTSSTSRFLREVDVEDQWHTDDTYGNMANIDPLADKVRSVPALIPRKNAVEDYELFYHCTNWSCAIDIMDSGPDHQNGRRCLDFGISRSFYMTPDVVTALEWGVRNRERWHNEVAIVIFRISKGILEGASKNFNVVRFEQATPEWVNQVTSSRRCLRKETDLDKYHLIYGPMAKNPEGIVRGEKAKPKIPIRYQIAAKREITDEYLSKNTMGTIWLDKQKMGSLHLG
jgi:Protein of unknown function (DUF3990)